LPNSAAFLGFGRRGLREESAEIPKERAVEVGFGMVDAKTEELHVAGALASSIVAG